MKGTTVIPDSDRLCRILKNLKKPLETNGIIFKLQDTVMLPFETPCQDKQCGSLKALLSFHLLPTIKPKQEDSLDCSKYTLVQYFIHDILIWHLSRPIFTWEPI